MICMQFDDMGYVFKIDYTLFGDKHVAVQPALSAEMPISIDSSSNLTKVTGTTSDHSLYF